MKRLQLLSHQRWVSIKQAFVLCWICIINNFTSLQLHPWVLCRKINCFVEFISRRVNQWRKKNTVELESSVALWGNTNFFMVSRFQAPPDWTQASGLGGWMWSTMKTVPGRAWLAWYIHPNVTQVSKGLSCQFQNNFQLEAIFSQMIDKYTTNLQLTRHGRRESGRERERQVGELVKRGGEK